MTIKWHYECAECGHKNGLVWAMLAFSPFFLRCRACKTVMRVRKIFPYVVFTFLCFGVVLASYLQAHTADGRFAEELNVWVLLGLFIGFEFVVGLLMCNKAELEPVSGRRRKKHQPPEPE